jgi:hypothetical protein
MVPATEARLSLHPAETERIRMHGRQAVERVQQQQDYAQEIIPA